MKDLGTVRDETKPDAGTRHGRDHFELEGARGVELSFRPSRFTPDQLNVAKAEARYHDVDGRQAACRLVNISSSGAAFVLPGGEVLRNGQVIESFEALLDAMLVYSGRVHVVNQREADGVVIVGVAFVDEYVAPTKLDSASKAALAVRDVARRLEDLDRVVSGPVDEWVKSLTADFAILLGGLRVALDAGVPKNAAADVEDSVVKFVESQVGGRFHEFIRRMNDIPKRVHPEGAAACRDYMKRHLEELLLPAPIYRESYYKPLGYAGDYVTMNIAYTNHYQGDSAYAKFINRMFCDLMISRAAISRVPFLKKWISSVVEGRDSSHTRILSVASGPAREIQDYLTESGPRSGLEFTLFDQDPKALTFAQSALAPLALRFADRMTIRYLNGAVKHLVKDPARYAELGGQDLVYTAGLFDYLRSDVATRLMKNLFDLLAPGGRLVVGNLSPACDSQGFLETLVDWQIIYRTDEELVDLAKTCPAKSLRVEAEATGVNRFLVVER
jgi:SAM-dependent methyltransferase